MTQHTYLGLLCALLTGCGGAGGMDVDGDPDAGTGSTGGGGIIIGGTTVRTPTEAEVAEARVRLDAALLAAERGRAALELLGLFPVYTCGDARRSWVAQLAVDVEAEYGCVTATTQARGDAADAIVLTFEGTRCTVRGHTVTGSLEFLFTTGADRFEVFADLRDTEVDGHPLQTKVGYGVCGDEERYWAESAGAVPKSTTHTYALDALLRRREGMPIFGSPTSIIDGDGTLTGPAGADTVVITALEYEQGEKFPRTGQVEVTTAGGHRYRATFREVFWDLGEAEVQVDSKTPVRIPLLR